MDRVALARGNLLLGNDEDAAGIEAQVFPFEVGFEAGCAFAVTGADRAAALDGAPVLPWCAGHARAGQVLRLGPPRGGCRRGARPSLRRGRGGRAARPGVAQHATARRLRGLGRAHVAAGRPLAAGSRPADARPPIGVAAVPPAPAMPLERGGLPAVRVLPAAEYDPFTPAAREAFWSEPWTVTPRGDRHGSRLTGPGLELIAPTELCSHGVVPGVIQVPHGGQPIARMCDAQPSGGYPKIGAVIEADLWRLSQAPIGARVRSLETTWDDALAARDETRAWLAEVRRLLDPHRARSGNR